jgi:hypothetical protein
MARGAPLLADGSDTDPGGPLGAGSAARPHPSADNAPPTAAAYQIPFMAVH